MSTEPRLARTWLVCAVLLVVVGGLLRFIGLEHNPPGLWQDEASTGLDAYLLWTTGKDQAGQFLPLIARSFGDYPLALYRYLDAPIVGLFGLTPGNERLVAALFGTIMILATGWLVLLRTDRITALAVMISCVFCPTWVHFSRYGSEAILLPCTLVGGWLLIELGRRRRLCLWLGAFVLGLSAYTYHAVKLILPLWIIGFLILQWPLIKQLWREEKKHIIGPALIFALVVLPSAYLAITPGGMARGRTVLAWYHIKDVTRLLHYMGSNYLSYFDPGMLFVRGGPAVAQSIPGLGLWNLIDLPLMVLGIRFLVVVPKTPHKGTSERRRFCYFVLFWFLLGPLPGGISVDLHNIGRAIAWLPAPQIISGIGAAALLRWCFDKASQNRIAQRLVTGAYGLGWCVTGFAVFQLTLFTYPQVTERDWQFEISAAMQCAKRMRHNNERLIVSPAFQSAPVFAMFHFTDSSTTARIWNLRERTSVGKNELYVFPAHRPKPRKGKELCRIIERQSKRPRAYVYGYMPPEKLLKAKEQPDTRKVKTPFLRHRLAKPMEKASQTTTTSRLRLE